MSDPSGTHINIAENAASAMPVQPASSSSGQSTDSAAALKDFANPWLDSSQYWHDGGFTEPGGPAYAPYAYSFGDSSPSFFPNEDTVKESRLQGSSSATAPRAKHHQRGHVDELDYEAALRDVLLHRVYREEQEKQSQLGSEWELHRQAPSEIPFPSLEADGYRDLDLREKERQRVRSMGAASQRGTRKESGRRDSGPREGLRATKDTESLDQMKDSARELYRGVRYKLQVGFTWEDVDNEEDPKWLSQLLAQRKSAAGSAEAKSTRGGGRSKKSTA